MGAKVDQTRGLKAASVVPRYISWLPRIQCVAWAAPHLAAGFSARTFSAFKGTILLVGTGSFIPFLIFLSVGISAKASAILSQSDQSMTRIHGSYVASSVGVVTVAYFAFRLANANDPLGIVMLPFVWGILGALVHVVFWLAALIAQARNGAREHI